MANYIQKSKFGNLYNTIDLVLPSIKLRVPKKYYKGRIILPCSNSECGATYLNGKRRKFIYEDITDDFDNKDIDCLKNDDTNRLNIFKQEGYKGESTAELYISALYKTHGLNCCQSIPAILDDGKTDLDHAVIGSVSDLYFDKDKKYVGVHSYLKAMENMSTNEEPLDNWDLTDFWAITRFIKENYYSNAEIDDSVGDEILKKIIFGSIINQTDNSTDNIEMLAYLKGDKVGLHLAKDFDYSYSMWLANHMDDYLNFFTEEKVSKYDINDTDTFDKILSSNGKQITHIYTKLCAGSGGFENSLAHLIVSQPHAGEIFNSLKNYDSKAVDETIKSVASEFVVPEELKIYGELYYRSNVNRIERACERELSERCK